MSDVQRVAEVTDGNHLVVEALRMNGVSTIYGVVGIPITDLARIAQAEGIRYIGFRNEQAAGHAAAAAGYLTQRPGICLTVSAPGFLNGMVALANATTNCFPMILISGSSDRATIDLKQGDYEELDQLASARPFAKAAFRVDKPELIGDGVARALRTALSGRPGGVYLDLPAQVLREKIDKPAGDASLFTVATPGLSQLPSRESITRALDLLRQAERPLIILGKGAAYAQADEQIRTFIEATGCPFLPMSMAKGLLPDDHPQSAAAARSLVLGNADVVMLIGARLNWLLGHGQPPEWSPDCKFIQLDISPEEMDSNRPIAAPVVGDIKSAMTELLARMNPGDIKPREAWLESVSAKKMQNAERMRANLAREPVPMDFFSSLRAIRDVLDSHRDAFIVSEGANTLDHGRNILNMYEPRKRLDSGTWGVMGVGLGYAIAAAVESGSQVVAVEGDSAFGFSGMEIETMCRYGLPIVVIVFNNNGVYRGDDVNPFSSDPAPTVFTPGSRYDRLIEAFGGTGYHAETTAALATALQQALDTQKPALINCVIDPKAGTQSGHLEHLN
jgi:oxalyl-CoA decarboxylase